MRIVSSRLCGFLGAALVLSSVLLASACPPKEDANKEETPPATSDDKPATGPVAEVNGVALPREKLNAQLERTQQRFQRSGREISPALELRMKENLIRKMVEEELVRQEAKKQGITVSAEEVGEKFQAHKDRFGPNDQAFQSFLERTHQKADDIRADLEQDLLREKLLVKVSEGAEPADADVQKFYNENKDRYRQKEQIKASHILFKVEASTTDEEKKAKWAQAEQVAAQAKKKGSDFAALATEHSEGVTKSRGGDLGTFSRGRMVKPFEDAAFAAKVGEIIGPLETQFGYHVIKVFEKIPERDRDFAEVKDAIKKNLSARERSRANRDLVARLKKEADIKILEPGISIDRSPSAQMVSPTGGNLVPSKALEKLQQDLSKASSARLPPGSITPRPDRRERAQPGRPAPGQPAPKAAPQNR